MNTKGHGLTAMPFFIVRLIIERSYIIHGISR